MPEVGPRIVVEQVVAHREQIGQVVAQHVRGPGGRYVDQQLFGVTADRDDAEGLAGMQVVRHHRRDIADHGVGEVEAVLDAHRLLGGRTPEMLASGGGPVGVQQRPDVGDQRPGVRIAIVERVRPEDHPDPAAEQLGHDGAAHGQRIDPAVGVHPLPGRRIEHGSIGQRGDRSTLGRDQFDLRSADDAEVLRRDVHAVPLVAVDAGLTGGKDQVIDRVHRIEAGRLLRIAVIQPDVGELPALDEVGVASRVVHIERRPKRGTMTSSTLRRVGR